jgi:hypothetical protein
MPPHVVFAPPYSLCLCGATRKASFAALLKATVARLPTIAVMLPYAQTVQPFDHFWSKVLEVEVLYWNYMHLIHVVLVVALEDKAVVCGSPHPSYHQWHTLS